MVSRAREAGLRSQAMDTVRSVARIAEPRGGNRLKSVRRVRVTPLTRRRRASAGRTNGPASRRIMGCSVRGCGETDAVFEVREEAMHVEGLSGEETAGIYVVGEIG